MHCEPPGPIRGAPRRSVRHLLQPHYHDLFEEHPADQSGNYFSLTTTASPACVRRTVGTHGTPTLVSWPIVGLALLCWPSPGLGLGRLPPLLGACFKVPTLHLLALGGTYRTTKKPASRHSLQRPVVVLAGPIISPGAIRGAPCRSIRHPRQPPHHGLTSLHEALHLAHIACWQKNIERHMAPEIWFSWPIVGLALLCWPSPGLGLGHPPLSVSLCCTAFLNVMFLMCYYLWYA